MRYSCDGWSADIEASDDAVIPDGGIIVKNIMHKNYPFAEDIRVTGFWVEIDKFEGYAPPKTQRLFLPINRETFDFGKLEVVLPEVNVTEFLSKRPLFDID